MEMLLGFNFSECCNFRLPWEQGIENKEKIWRKRSVFICLFNFNDP